MVTEIIGKVSTAKAPGLTMGVIQMSESHISYKL